MIVLPFKDPCPKDFTAHYMDLVNCPFYLLYSIPLFHSYCFFAYLLCSPYLLPGLFLISSFLLLFLISIISNSFPIFSNIPYQISCHSIYIVVLLYIFLVILFHDLLSSFSSLFFQPLLYIFSQIYLLILAHSPDFLLVPKCFFLLYNPSIILDIYLFL